MMPSITHLHKVEKPKKKDRLIRQGTEKLSTQSIQGKTEHAHHLEQSQVTGDGSFPTFDSENDEQLDFRKKLQDEASARERKAGEVHAEKEDQEEGQSHVHFKKENVEHLAQDPRGVVGLVSITAIRPLRLLYFFVE